MSKAIAGAALLAGAAVLAFVPGLNVLGTPLLLNLMFSLAAGGVAMEAGAIAEALTSQRGQNITTRMAAGLRQIIYGTQRVGGVILYQSTTGAGGAGGHYVYNFVIAVATHEIDAFVNVFLDGRQVFFKQDGNFANIGCGSVATPPTTTVSVSGGSVTGVTASGGSGFSPVKPTRYRVVFRGGGGSGAAGYAHNSGTVAAPVWSVTVTAGGSAYTSTPTAEIQGAYTFGGVGAADEQDPSKPGYGTGYGQGPSGEHYNFSGKVFCDVRFGDQPAGDYMASLRTNDSVWPTTARLGGIAYIYLNVGYDTGLFPSLPEIKFTINGKNTIFDPRSGKLGFSTNWALQVADVLTDINVGLGDDSVNQAQLIAAANVCDELVALDAQPAEKRYSQSIHYDTSISPGDALLMMMPSAAGRLSRIGGEWFIWPAYWQGASFSFDQSALIATPTWTPKRSFKDLFNRVSGTYIAPNYPYNVAGNLYDSNGWYYGTRDNIWPFAWQPTNFPQYAADRLHGYAADEFLAEDGGIQLPKEIALRGVISIAQAQRLAKIELMRNRYQGSGSFPLKLGAFQMQPIDVLAFDWPAMEWTLKTLEVTSVQFVAEEDQSGEGNAIRLYVRVGVIETDSLVYEWSIGEELSPYDVPDPAAQIPATPAPPTLFTVTSSAGTAVVGADGVVIPRALLEWNAPLDISVTGIQIQYKLTSSSTWLAAGTVDVALFEQYVGSVVAGQMYDFQIRSVRPNGQTSVWVQDLGVTISITLSISSTGNPVAPPGTLTAVAVAGGTANIIVWPFTAQVHAVTAPCLPSGPYTITGLNCAQHYYVYYIDPTFAGGAITPIATSDTADFVGKLGYYLIGDIVTPSALSGPTNRPSSYTIASGSVGVTTPEKAYDSNPTTWAEVPAFGTGSTGNPIDHAFGSTITYAGFPSTVLSAAATLSVQAEILAGGAGAGAGCNQTIAVSLDGGTTFTTLISTGTGAAMTTYTLTVPSGTNLANIQVYASGTGSTLPAQANLTLRIYEISVA
jgi:hypothetical protein